MAMYVPSEGTACWFCEIDDIDVEVWVTLTHGVRKRKCRECCSEAPQRGLGIRQTGPLGHDQLRYFAAPQTGFRIVTFEIADAAVRGEHRGGSDARQRPQVPIANVEIHARDSVRQGDRYKLALVIDLDRLAEVMRLDHDVIGRQRESAARQTFAAPAPV